MSFQNPVKIRVLLVPDYDGGLAYDSWRSNTIVNGTINRHFHYIVVGNPLHHVRPFVGVFKSQFPKIFQENGALLGQKLTKAHQWLQERT